MIPEIPLILPWLRDRNSEAHNDKYPSFSVPPKVIYRYLSAERAIQAICNKYLWFSSPNNFNDPLDMYMGLIDFSIDKLRSKKFANGIRKDQPRSIKRSVARDAIERQDKLIRGQKEIFENDKTTSGVCCFSKMPNVSLMWSHYAQSHTGICLGFNIEPYRPDPFFLVQPVSYPAEVIPKNIYDHKGMAISHWVLTKSKVWNYEQEVRAFCLHKNGAINFDKECLKEVYFGCGTSVINRESILTLLEQHNYRHIKIKEMVIDEKLFDVKAVEYDRLTKTPLVKKK